jgi:hypothetical protein
MPFGLLVLLVALGLLAVRTNQQLSGLASDGFASPATAGSSDPQYLAPKDLPILLFSDAGITAWDELNVGRKRETPPKFYYRIIPPDSALDPKHQPWATTNRVAPGTTCADLIANSYIRIRTIIDSEGSRKIPLEPVPFQVEWKGNTFKTDNPGINKNRVSACCDAATCTDRCLQFETGQTWLLEISAPQWGIDTSYDPVEYRSNQGGGYFKQAEQSDPGMWPVLRVPCVYCPLLNCITNCSNGEYATGYSEYLVRAFIERSTECLTPDLRRSWAGGGLSGAQDRMQTVRPWDLEYMRGQGNLPLVPSFQKSSITVFDLSCIGTQAHTFGSG